MMPKIEFIRTDSHDDLERVWLRYGNRECCVEFSQRSDAEFGEQLAYQINRLLGAVPYAS